MSAAHPSRRRFLGVAGGAAVVAAAAAVGLETGVVPGRDEVNRAVGLAGSSRSSDRVVSGSFVSAQRLGARCGWTIAYPPGPAVGLRVLVVLHGFHNDHSAAFGDGLHLDRYLDAAVAAGVAPFAIAAVDGGNTFWHRRTSGEDAGAMVRAEFIPLLASRGLDVSKVGFLGWSMGGYGALLLAGELGPNRVGAVVAESIAVWPSAGQTAAGAFDSPADYAEFDVLGRQRLLTGIPVRIDCGDRDGFVPITRQYAAGVAVPPAGGFEPGGHTMSFWRSQAPAQLRFVGAHLPH